jgi:hypothetical protein
VGAVGDEQRLIKLGKAEQPDDHRSDIGQDQVAAGGEELVVRRDDGPQAAAVHELELGQVQAHKPMTELEVVVQDGSEQLAVGDVQIAPHLNDGAGGVG